MSGKSIWAKKRSRRALTQAVYQWQMSEASFTELVAQFEDGDALKKADVEFFRESLMRIVHHAGEIDALFVPFLDRGINELDKVELALLRLGCDELKNRLEVPFRVVIDEYVELAKTFGAEDSHKYINGVLDKAARVLRVAESGGAA